MFRRFPIEYQMDSQDCGPASLKMVAKYFGKYYSLQYLRDQCGIHKKGVSLLDLSYGAEHIGLHTLAISRLSFIGTKIILSSFTTQTKNISG